MAGDTLAKTGIMGSILALVSAVCCVLPLVLILLGLGGAWLSIFGAIAAAAYYVVGVTAVIIAIGWFAAIRRHATQRTYRLLFLGSALTLIAWLVIFNESAINGLLVGLT